MRPGLNPDASTQSVFKPTEITLAVALLFLSFESTDARRFTFALDREALRVYAQDYSIDEVI